MSGFTPINQGCTLGPKDALHERQNNCLHPILNSDEQIAMLNDSRFRGTSHPGDDSDQFADTRTDQDGHQAPSQANGNGTTTLAKTMPVLALLHSNNEKIERLQSSLISLQDEIKAQWDQYYDIHRKLPSYNLGLVTRPQLSPNHGSNSIFKGCSSPHLGIPKPATPRTPLRVLPAHRLTEAGVVSVDDCQHMYEAGVSGKHDELKDVYHAVANAPGYESHEFDGNKLRPMQQHPPSEFEEPVAIRNAHNAMLGMTDRLWQAEPETSLEGPKGKWEKETIGAFFPEIESDGRKTRVYENAESSAGDNTAVAEAHGAEGEYGCANGGLGGVTGHQMAMYGNSEDFNGYGEQTNDDHRGMREGLYVMGNGYRGQANADHHGVNGGSQSSTSTPLNTNRHNKDAAEGNDHMAELFRDISNARPGTNGHDSAIQGAHEILERNCVLHDGIQDDHTTIFVVHYRDTDGGRQDEEESLGDVYDGYLGMDERHDDAYDDHQGMDYFRDDDVHNGRQGTDESHDSVEGGHTS